MTSDSQKNENEKETPKGEDPPYEKVAKKIAEQSGKQFQGQGKEKKG